MSLYYNPTTHQTATINSDKADKDGNVWVEIDSALPTKINYEQFIKAFREMGNETKIKS